MAVVTLAAALPAVPSQAGVDAAILPRPTRVAAMPPLTRAAAIPVEATTITVGLTVAEALTTLAGSTPAEVITTVVVFGLALTLASGSASRSAGATMRVPDVATMTGTAIGSRLRAIRTSTRVTDRIDV